MHPGAKMTHDLALVTCSRRAAGLSEKADLGWQATMARQAARWRSSMAGAFVLHCPAVAQNYQAATMQKRATVPGQCLKECPVPLSLIPVNANRFLALPG